MSIIDTLITDRTPNGFYGTSDLNRVGEAMMYIADRLKECGYVVTISPRTDWADTEMMPQAPALTLLNDLTKIRAALSGPFPPVPDGVKPFDADEANDIERILAMVEAHIDRMMRTIDLGWAMGIAHTGLFGGI